MGTPVKVHVYDVTQGMATRMAPFLLGRPLEGVWHTAIVVYGHEYFYGNGGITYCPPGETIIGAPTRILDFGMTEIPQEIFHEYLLELGSTRFTGNEYHLLDHNCNTFINEAAQFLTGQSIPEYIINLPAEVLSTPFGRIMRPFIDGVMRAFVTGGNTVHIGPADLPPSLTPPVTPKPNAVNEENVADYNNEESNETSVDVNSEHSSATNTTQPKSSQNSSTDPKRTGGGPNATSSQLEDFELD